MSNTPLPMNSDGQGGQAEADSPEKALWGGKWFWPILQDLEKFEKATEHLCPEANEAIADDAPDLLFNSVWKCGQSMADYNGLDVPQKIDARRVGMMIGSKWSICNAHARAFPVWSMLKPEQIRELDAAWWVGFSHECTQLAREFSEKWTPLFRDIRRKAMDLALKDGLSDELDYIQGYTQGTHYMAKAWENMKPAKHKRGKDAQARNCVFAFTMCCGREIEKEKGNLSWPVLYEGFLEFTGHKVEIDEDAFKQILVRAGLTGVGKVGRPVPIHIVTP